MEAIKRKTGIPWSEAEVEALHNLLRDDPGRTNDYYARKLENQFGAQYTSESIRKKLSRSNVTFINQKNAEERDVGDLIKTLIATQKELQRFDDRQTEITLEIEDDKPIGIAFTGDQHIGGLYTDHEGMIKDYKTIQETDGLYDVLMGDLRDNYITRSHAGGSFEQAFTADHQGKVAEHIVTKYLADKTLAVLKGNHDFWSVKETGEDFIQYLAQKINKPYLWYGGEITVRLNGAEYKIHAHHTYKYNSTLNTTNSQRNLFNASQADVIALAHLHWNEVHQKSAGGKDTIWMRTGSYKITDDYTQYLGGFRSDPRVPMVIFWPGTKKMLGFRDLYDGIAHLKMLRETSA